MTNTSADDDYLHADVQCLFTQVHPTPAPALPQINIHFTLSTRFTH